MCEPALRVPQDGVNSKTTVGCDVHTVKGFMWHACIAWICDNKSRNAACGLQGEHNNIESGCPLIF